MSQFKYCIFVFLVLNSFLSFPQQIEDDVEIRRNEIAFKIIDTKLKIQNGNFDVALKNLENLLSETEKINDKKSQAIVLSNFSDLYLATENIESAETYIFKAISIQNNIDDPLNLAISRFIHGKIKFKKLEFKTALDLFNSSRTIFKEQGLDKMYVEATFKVAKTLIELNKLNEANLLLDEVILLSKTYDYKDLHSAALNNIGLIAFKETKLEKALTQTKKGLQLSVTINDLTLQKESNQILGLIYEALGSYELQAKSLKSYINLDDSLAKIEKERTYPEKENTKQIIAEKDAIIENQESELIEKKETTSLARLITILSVALITILSLLTLSLYKNNNIRLKTNNMLYKKNEELLTEKERAEIAAKTKSNFLSTVTHELRTPLYAVTGLTKMLLEENPKPDQIQHLKSLQFSGDYLLTFINDILQINKIEANKVELDPEIFNLKTKVENVVAALNNSAMDNNTLIHIEYDTNLPYVFDGDQLKISQILINLIGNSIKFTKDGDIWVRVTQLKKTKKNHFIRIEVEDNGIGITQEKQEHMFESFSQGSVQINRKYGGTGLGLSIVKGLIDILKGKIYLKSEIGKGTSFFIELSITESEKTVKVKKRNYSEDIIKLDLKDVKILVVEDNKINQMITKKILNKMALNCDVIDNGEEAVEMVKETSYNIVLMDIHMPGISGIEATKRIRSFDKDLTIFALTAVTVEDKMQEFDEAGFNDIISKPFKQEDFEKKLYLTLSDDKPITIA